MPHLPLSPNTGQTASSSRRTCENVIGTCLSERSLCCSELRNSAAYRVCSSIAELVCKCEGTEAGSCGVQGCAAPSDLHEALLLPLLYSRASCPAVCLSRPRNEGLLCVFPP